MTAKVDKVEKAKVDDHTIADLTKAIKGENRDTEFLATAIASKARLMVESGLLVFSEDCLNTCCPAAHVARIHLHLSDLSESEYTRFIDGNVPCGDVECVCNPDYGAVHTPRETNLDALGDIHYFPRPMSG
jgi:hypothetical protein